MRDATLEELKQKVPEIQWHHTIDLGHGVITPGRDNSPRKLKRVQLPPALQGKTVLDVGAWDGFFSFEAERRGARRVLATDSFIWNGCDKGASKRGFELARQTLGSHVEDMHIDVLELSPERVGTFDVVLFLGVLYHMKHPLLALEKVSSVTKELLIVETTVDLLWTRRSAMAFYEKDEMGNDPTNWCGPNPAAVVAMLRTVGFRRIEVVAGLRSVFFRLARAAYYKFKRGYPFFAAARTDRIVVHAWK
jgi:tRNA (mo5U34)-methyltransferase